MKEANPVICTPYAKSDEKVEMKTENYFFSNAGRLQMPIFAEVIWERDN